jgi:hypothetical protein
MRRGSKRWNVTAEVNIEYILVLNPMMQNTEAYKEFGPFPSMEDAIKYHNDLLVETYLEEGPDWFGGPSKTYRKSFQKGSELEWMNPLMSFEPGLFGHGIHETYRDLKVINKCHEV